MKVLAIDVGGTHVKILATGQETARKFESGRTLTAKEMVSGVLKLAADWEFDVVSIGYPGPVVRDRPIAEPKNLGEGWVAFDYAAAFGRPVKLMNDAAMQALGSYEGGKMLFLGLGTGLGSAMVVHGIVEPMELAHLPYRKETFEDYVGLRGLDRLGKKSWRRFVFDVIARLTAALEPEYVVLGGGNVKKLSTLPPNCRLGSNANAFRGGFRLWEPVATLVSAGGQTLPPIVPEQPTFRKITTMTSPLTSRASWQALASHYHSIQNVHLRQLFADDPRRGERYTLEAAGLV
ncbi:MAG TPA: ROK family protein, partial [Pirellulales bacterium]